MTAGAAVLQGCSTLLTATGEVKSPDKLSAGSVSGWMGDAEEPPETKQRRAVYERPSCKEPVFGKMLANEAALLCAPYAQYDLLVLIKYTSVL